MVGCGQHAAVVVRVVRSDDQIPEGGTAPESLPQSACPHGYILVHEISQGGSNAECTWTELWGLEKGEFESTAWILIGTQGCSPCLALLLATEWSSLAWKGCLL